MYLEVHVVHKPTPGASKQHRSKTAEVFWQDAIPLVEHPDEVRGNRLVRSACELRGDAAAIATRDAKRAVAIIVGIDADLS